MTEFRFSPRPSRAAEINWLPWGPEAFKRAGEENKPVLLSLSAVWCHWCHVMDETSYSDSENIAIINEHYVPVRVDNDRRPDINRRYNMGGWPTTAFLTPRGDPITGATYLSPKQLRSFLVRVKDLYREHRAELLQRAASVQAPAEGPPPSPGIARNPDVTTVRTVEAALEREYDPAHGGFGREPKFPHPEAISFWLIRFARTRQRRLKEMIVKTLETMAARGIYDQVDGGFFRYSTTRDWEIPHYEKLCEDNARLLNIYLDAYRLFGLELFRETAQGIIKFAQHNLSGPEGTFYGSQDSDEDYYALNAAGRRGREAPCIDPTIYTGWNALMGSAYLNAFKTLGLHLYRDRALQCLTFLWKRGFKPREGMYRYYDGRFHPPVELADQVDMLHLLMDAYEATGETGHLERAEVLGKLVRRRFGDEETGGFFDLPQQDTAGSPRTVGRLRVAEKPLGENARAARAYLRLAWLTDQPELEELARETLSLWSRTYAQLGIFAADFGLAVDLLLNPPLQVVVVGHRDRLDTRELVDEALRGPQPDRVLRVLDPTRDRERLEKSGYPPMEEAVAYLCEGRTCTPPIKDPQELGKSLALRDNPGH